MALSSDGHPIQRLGLLKSVEVSTSERDELTCGSVVRNTAHDISKADQYTVEKAASNRVAALTVPIVYQSNNSSATGHRCMFRGQYINKTKTFAHMIQYGDHKAIGKSTVDELDVNAS